MMSASLPGVAEQELSPLLAAAFAPIPGDSPAGVDVTYDDDFQRMKGAIDALASATSATVDFQEVARIGEIVLGTKSKDLRVAAFTAMALERTRGIDGLADGLSAVEMILQNYWEEMYPPMKRMAARQNALQSMSDKVKEWVVERAPAAENRETLEQALECVRRLQAFTMERMDERAPALSGLSQSLEALLRKTPKPAPPAAEAAPAAAPRAPDRAPTASAPPQMDRSEWSASDVERTLLQIAESVARKDRTSPLPYRLSRMALWDTLTEEPPVEDGRTMIPPPPGQLSSYLRGLLDDKHAATLSEEVESAFREFPLWLDLQRLQAAALDALSAGNAKEAVVNETAVLLRRVPVLLRLSFSDGTPLADPLTRTWIDIAVKGAAGTDATSGRPSTSGGRLDEQFQAARQKLGSGKLSEAVADMRQGIHEDDGERSFERRLYLARLCMHGGELRVARVLLEELSAEVDRFFLPEWKPSIALDAWSALYRCYEDLLQREETDVAALKEAVFERICCLDPEHALRLQKDG
jgi:type VI secretion system protein VasJ